MGFLFLPKNVTCPLHQIDNNHDNYNNKINGETFPCSGSCVHNTFHAFIQFPLLRASPVSFAWLCPLLIAHSSEILQPYFHCHYWRSPYTSLSNPVKFSFTGDLLYRWKRLFTQSPLLLWLQNFIHHASPPASTSWSFSTLYDKPFFPGSYMKTCHDLCPSHFSLYPLHEESHQQSCNRLLSETSPGLILPAWDVGTNKSAWLQSSTPNILNLLLSSCCSYAYLSKGLLDDG